MIRMVSGLNLSLAKQLSLKALRIEARLADNVNSQILRITPDLFCANSFLGLARFFNFGKIPPTTASPPRQIETTRAGLTAEMESRLAQIQAAIRRGEALIDMSDWPCPLPYVNAERASREPDNEEEQLLEKLFVRPEDLEEAYDASPEDPPAPAGQEQEDPHTVRIRSKTIESGAEPDIGAPVMHISYQKVRRLQRMFGVSFGACDEVERFCPDGALAWEILQEIVALGSARREESGERPSVEAYDIVIEAFARHGATDDALAVFKAVKEAGLEPTDQSYDWLATPASRSASPSGEYRFVEMLFAAKASTKADGQIGSRALKLLLDAYANGLPRQASKDPPSAKDARFLSSTLLPFLFLAQSAFRGAMVGAPCGP
ncbi:hypothetical protein AK812_SmicGene24247 [Symbiodinium microadriaticum]|uniref:Pentatricopeptide repeat-containing protein n=1 Tax=Symbiodinium microadriaticum TaxID=2951 RepID=A0A1Q9DF25_SYMMI|nr:hypothetical protein AK812_SmicGene24247 [Symbiodinium microadriaticum]